MGYFLQEHDIYVGSLLDELNVRFAPAQRSAKAPGMAVSHYGGIEEMVALQKEFKIFKRGRTFKTSVSALNIGAFNNDVKNRWLQYLESLARHGSNKKGLNGDAAIVSGLIRNLGSKEPLPVHFTSHDLRQDDRVLVTDRGQPLFYLDIEFMTISLPMQPASAVKAKKQRAAKSGAAAKQPKPKKG